MSDDEARRALLVVCEAAWEALNQFNDPFEPRAEWEAHVAHAMTGLSDAVGRAYPMVSELRVAKTAEHTQTKEK